jgi:hypothetical protein
MTLDELVDEATRKIHSGLLENGGNGMKDQVYVWLVNTAIWATEKGNIIQIPKGG